jgi:hypothetical protein
LVRVISGKGFAFPITRDHPIHRSADLVSPLPLSFN